MLHASSPIPQNQSPALALSSDLARLYLHASPVMPTVSATFLPASAGPQAVGFVCATVTARQVTVYASSSPPTPQRIAPCPP